MSPNQPRLKGRSTLISRMCFAIFHFHRLGKDDRVSEVPNEEAFVSSNPNGRNTGSSGLLKYQSWHRQGKLHCKPHCARVTRHSFGPWQWMVMCTQRSDLCYLVENFLNPTIREKNWVSGWSTPTWGGISMLSYRVFELCESKAGSQDGFWSIMSNGYSV